MSLGRQLQIILGLKEEVYLGAELFDYQSLVAQHDDRKALVELDLDQPVVVSADRICHGHACFVYDASRRQVYF